MRVMPLYIDALLGLSEGEWKSLKTDVRTFRSENLQNDISPYLKLVSQMRGIKISLLSV